MRKFIEFRCVCNDCGKALEVAYGDICKSEYLEGEMTGAFKVVTGIRVKPCQNCYDKTVAKAKRLAALMNEIADIGKEEAK